MASEGNIEVWVVRVYRKDDHAIVLEKTKDKEIVKETIANIQTLDPDRSYKWSSNTGKNPITVDVPAACPFCGNGGCETSWVGGAPTFFVAGCSNCGAKGPGVRAAGSTDEDIKSAMDEALLRWSKRM